MNRKVRDRLDRIDMKVLAGVYPVVSWERRDLEPREGPPTLRLCQHCSDVIRTFNTHPSQAVSCNLCEVGGK